MPARSLSIRTFVTLLLALMLGAAVAATPASAERLQDTLLLVPVKGPQSSAVGDFLSFKISKAVESSAASTASSKIRVRGVKLPLTIPAAPKLGVFGRNEVTFSRHIDSLSPDLQKAAVAGTAFKAVQVAFKPQDGAAGGANYCFENAVVLSYHVGTGGGDLTPVESVTLNFQTMKFQNGFSCIANGSSSNSALSPPVNAAVTGVGGDSLKVGVRCFLAKCKGDLEVAGNSASCSSKGRKCSLIGLLKVNLTAGKTKVYSLHVGGAGKRVLKRFHKAGVDLLFGSGGKFKLAGTTSSEPTGVLDTQTKASSIGAQCPSPAVVGQNVVVSGAIAPSPGFVPVTVSVTAPDGSHSAFTLGTDQNGSYKFVLSAAQVGTYQVAVSWAGNAKTAGANGGCATQVVKLKPTAAISCAPTFPMNGTASQPFTGSVVPGVAGQVTITFAPSPPVASHTYVHSVTLSNTGTFSDTLSLLSSPPTNDPTGTWTATVDWPGDATTEPASASCNFLPG